MSVKDTKATILLVEDDERDAHAVQSILENEYSIIITHDSAEAIRQLYLSEVHLIMLDINLGDKSLSGFQLIDYLKMQKRFDHVKVIALTGRSVESMQLNSSFKKFDDYLYKPVTKESVLEKIKRTLNKADGENS